MAEFGYGDKVWVWERRAAVVVGVDEGDPDRPYRVSFEDGDSGWPAAGTRYERRDEGDRG